MIIKTGPGISREESMRYVEHLQDKYNRKVEYLKIELDGDFVNLHYRFVPVPFERIRRITGYLVGDMSAWNDAKRAEEADRVKHGTSSELEQL